MPVQLTGLGGFDSSNVITQLVAIAKQPIDAIDQKKAQVDSASSTLSTFAARLSTLKATANALSDLAGYSSFAATSSDASVVASAGGGAQAGTYDVQITTLAAVQKLRGSTQASSGTALGLTGSLSIQVGSTAAVPVAVTATDTLGDVATKIAASGARVTASVIYDGNTYRLSVQSADTGMANAFTITQTGFDLGLSNPANIYQTASDAAFKVDGLPITGPTNQVTGVIPGVTLALTKVASATVRVTSDTTALKQKLQGFVSAYNDIVNAGHTATGFSGTKAQNPVLAGETSIRRSLDSFGRLVATAVPGTTGAYTTLGSVGVKLAANGTLSLDTAKLDAAIAKDPDGVRRLFVTDPALGATGVMKTFATTADSLVTGATSPIKARMTALSTRSRTLEESKVAKQKRVDLYEKQLRKQFSDLDQAMSRYSTMSSTIGNIKTPT